MAERQVLPQNVISFRIPKTMYNMETVLQTGLI